jgi:hypothetical protein
MIDQRLTCPSVGDGGCLAQDLPMVFPPAAGQQGQEGKDTGVGGSAEGEGCHAVCTPSQGAQDVARIGAYRCEGRVEYEPADGVEDDVEALPGGVLVTYASTAVVVQSIDVTPKPWTTSGREGDAVAKTSAP